MSKIMVSNICKGFAKNETLTELNIGENNQITSHSTSTIADLIKATTSVADLHIYGTLLNNDDNKTICMSLATTKLKVFLS